MAEKKSNLKKYKILRLLDSIPQIDARRANLIAAYTCDGKRFKTKHQYWAYTGLVRYYDRKRSQGLDHRKARKALARKVDAIVLSVFKTERPYDDKFEEKRDVKKIIYPKY